MKAPTPEEMELAADWLESNDGDESPIMKDVAAWLYQKAQDTRMREACKEMGVSVTKLRQKLKETKP